MGTPKIAVVDYQAGNLRSVQKALERYGAEAVVTSGADVIGDADALVFPGQGANDSSIAGAAGQGPCRPHQPGSSPAAGPSWEYAWVSSCCWRRPTRALEPGLGALRGRVRALPGGLKVPHMGWNQVALVKEHPVLDGVPTGSYFYFVHSYYADPEDERPGSGHHLIRAGSSARWRPYENVVATQFHPEKSGAVGLKLYENFVRVAGRS